MSLSLIMAIGPQNAFVLRAGMLRQHLGLTVAVCAVSDAVLIALGVGAVSLLGRVSPWVVGLLLGGGAAYLLHYSAQALGRCLRPACASGLVESTPGLSRRTALAQALAFTWLNPHAWLDTAVLIGSASLAHTAPANWIFGAGAATGSALWFALWGAAARLAGHQLQGPQVARVLDGVVAVLCAYAALGLLAPLRALLTG